MRHGCGSFHQQTSSALNVYGSVQPLRAADYPSVPPAGQGESVTAAGKPGTVTKAGLSAGKGVAGSATTRPATGTAIIAGAAFGLNRSLRLDTPKIFQTEGMDRLEHIRRAMQPRRCSSPKVQTRSIESAIRRSPALRLAAELPNDCTRATIRRTHKNS